MLLKSNDLVHWSLGMRNRSLLIMGIRTQKSNVIIWQCQGISILKCYRQLRYLGVNSLFECLFFHQFFSTLIYEFYYMHIQPLYIYLRLFDMCYFSLLIHRRGWVGNFFFATLLDFLLKILIFFPSRNKLIGLFMLGSDKAFLLHVMLKRSEASSLWSSNSSL